MRTAVMLVALLGLALLLAGCAPGLNDHLGMPDGHGIVAGFWRGLWHGLIAPVTFVISLFSKNVQMYEVHNNGGWYNLGFLIGISATLGGGAKGGSAAGRRKS